MTYKEIFTEIKKLNGISPIWLSVLDLLKTIDNTLSDSVLSFFCMFFSLVDDGNICVSLNPEQMIKKWRKKWDGLITTDDEDKKNTIAFSEFEQIINDAIDEIKFGKCDKIISSITEQSLFVLDNDWLFISKYYESKQVIENKIKTLFDGQIDENPDESVLYELKQQLKDVCPAIELNNKQLLAVYNGINENLIITGGPGTGKTTIICFLLWKLLSDIKDTDYNIYMVAPSGKAADRMKESLLGTIDNFAIADKDVETKLKSIQSCTIHKLLSFSPQTKSFLYNTEHQFNSKSIFVIDEASMIDITLFQHLLNAIPSDARIFILGDKNQLPSVQEGAVLGELLDKKQTSVIKLDESKRFGSESCIGKLAQAIQMEDDNAFDDIVKFTEWSKWQENNDFQPKSQQMVHYIEFDSNENKRQQIENIVKKWSDTFYKKLVNLATGIDEDRNLDDLWNLANKARILSAERNSMRGTDFINRTICENIQSIHNIHLNGVESWFAGELLMINTNQNLYDLYNGDTGIVVTFKNSTLKYLMFKKENDINAQYSAKDISDSIFY
ncbi:MAG: AAA family ATPase, partial [Alphaproteobacteria bacterium]|nr:AAA family ATPase [Alphaproteobacteria bacterium]